MQSSLRLQSCARHDQEAVMIPDESPPPRPETEAPSPCLGPVNDNGGPAAAPIDPRILIIARVIVSSGACEDDT